jgi:hypothetical protein
MRAPKHQACSCGDTKGARGSFPASFNTVTGATKPNCYLGIYAHVVANAVTTNAGEIEVVDRTKSDPIRLDFRYA